MSPTSNLPEWFEQALAALRKGDIAGWMAIFCPSGRLRRPLGQKPQPRHSNFHYERGR